MEFKCHGISGLPHRWSGPAIVKAISMFDGQRWRFNLTTTKEEIELGRRYNDNETVLLTLQSAVEEEKFLKYPFSWIRAALLDCAERDYHYSHEKKWD